MRLLTKATSGGRQDWDGASAVAEQFRGLRVAMPTADERAATLRDRVSRSVSPRVVYFT
jgi:hypothetical protein